jgi:hypothetical protein
MSSNDRDHPQVIYNYNIEVEKALETQSEDAAALQRRIDAEREAWLAQQNASRARSRVGLEPPVDEEPDRVGQYLSDDVRRQFRLTYDDSDRAYETARRALDKLTWLDLSAERRLLWDADRTNFLDLRDRAADATRAWRILDDLERRLRRKEQYAASLDVFAYRMALAQAWRRDAAREKLQARPSEARINARTAIFLLSDENLPEPGLRDRLLGLLEVDTLDADDAKDRAKEVRDRLKAAKRKTPNGPLSNALDKASAYYRAICDYRAAKPWWLVE